MSGCQSAMGSSCRRICGSRLFCRLDIRGTGRSLDRADLECCVLPRPAQRRAALIAASATSEVDRARVTLARVPTR